MNHPPRRPGRRALAALTAGVALCAVPAGAAALDTTIRIEGASATLVPEGAIAIEADGTQATLYDSAFAPWQVDRGSAFWQVYRAASGASVAFDFKGYPFGLQVLTIGPDQSAGSVGWQYKVNHVSAMVGAESTQLAAGDSVLWFHGGFAGARDLDVTPSGDRIAVGTSFSVKVVSYDEDGVPSPAAGATVAYGASRATTAADGSATFIAQGVGVTGVRATRAGDVRSATRGVCSYEDDPTVCNLPAAPAAPAPTPAATASPDTVAPGSSIVTPTLRSTRGAVRSIRGTAGPDRSDIARVEVALGLRVGSLCRYRTAAGRLAPARECGTPTWLTARSAGGNWILPLGRRGLTPGTWRIESRAVDGAGNVESVRVPGANIGAVTVRRPVPRPVTRIGSPRAGRTRAAITRITGIAGPARADIALVEVAVARRTALGCRFITAAGRLGAARTCSRPVYVPAVSRGARWTRTLSAQLATGTWRIIARARSAEGTIGRPAVVNVVVPRPRIAR